MKRLNKMQKEYLITLLEVGHDYTSFEDLGFESTIALRQMVGNKSDENIWSLVDNFIKKYRKQKGAINE